MVSIPGIANGEIWTADDAARARLESGCEDLMLGRGAVADPRLVSVLRHGAESDWNAILPILQQFWVDVAGTGTDAQLAGRIKQWVGYLRPRWAPAAQLPGELKRATRPPGISRVLGDLRPLT